MCLRELLDVLQFMKIISYGPEWQTSSTISWISSLVGLYPIDLSTVLSSYRECLYNLQAHHLIPQSAQPGNYSLTSSAGIKSYVSCRDKLLHSCYSHSLESIVPSPSLSNITKVSLQHSHIRNQGDRPSSASTWTAPAVPCSSSSSWSPPSASPLACAPWRRGPPRQAWTFLTQ